MRALAVALCLAPFASACTNADCKALRQAVQSSCGEDSPAFTRLESLEGRGDAPCVATRRELTALRAVEANAAFHTAGAEEFCKSLAQADDDLDTRVELATHHYRLTATEAAGAAIDEAIGRGDYVGAQSLFAELDAFDVPSATALAAISLGWAFIRPLPDPASYAASEDTRWISMVSSVPTEGGGCSGTTGHAVALAPDPAKARRYFALADAPAPIRYVAYREGDLEAYDAAAGTVDSPAGDSAVERVNLLVAAGRHEEALTVATAAAAAFEPKQSQYVAYCALQVAIGRLEERAMRYAKARAAYETTDGCNRSASGRLAALRADGIVDGEPLPLHTVSGVVSGARFERLRVALIAQEPGVYPNVAETIAAFPDTSPHEDFTRVVAVEAKTEGGNFSARVPAGTWALTVVATGPTVVQRGGACWPVAVVVDADVELPNVELEARDP